MWRKWPQKRIKILKQKMGRPTTEAANSAFVPIIDEKLFHLDKKLVSSTIVN